MTGSRSCTALGDFHGVGPRLPENRQHHRGRRHFVLRAQNCMLMRSSCTLSTAVATSRR